MVQVSMAGAGPHRMFMNVGYELSEQSVRDYFSKFGCVCDVYLPRQSNGRYKGFGFATFSTAESLQAALKLSAHKVQGFTVQVKRAGPRPVEAETERATAPSFPEAESERAELKSNRLYVGGVADAISTPKLKQHFAKWGNVLDVSLCSRNASKHARDVTVTFDNYSSAQRARDQSLRSISDWPLDYISLAKPDSAFGRSPPGPAPAQPINVYSKAADQAVASHLQAQISASGCANLEQYAVYLQLQYNLLAEHVHTATDAAYPGRCSSLSSNNAFHSVPPPPPPPPPSTVNSDSYQSQTGSFYPTSIVSSSAPTSPPRNLSSKANSYGGMYSSPVISAPLGDELMLQSMPTNSITNEQMLQDMQASSLSDSQLLQNLQAHARTACLQALPPAPQSAASFPGWINSSALSHSDSLVPTSFSDAAHFPIDHFSAPDYSAYGAQPLPRPDSQAGAYASRMQHGYHNAHPRDASCRNSAGWNLHGIGSGDDGWMLQ